MYSLTGLLSNLGHNDRKSSFRPSGLEFVEHLATFMVALWKKEFMRNVFPFACGLRNCGCETAGDAPHGRLGTSRETNVFILTLDGTPCGSDTYNRVNWS